ncbi:MAG: Gfo/Idh/MocA family oxidoreductase, partial [Verrucomicrobiae bacterium]|nr:Gfo/Idh/MocA family oxidoreductase [Verrucomicrobiae bacterium]
MKSNRRDFLKRTALSGLALAGLPTLVPATVLGQNAPNNRIGMGLIGMGLIMGGHRNHFCGRPDTQVLAVCDVDARKRDAAKRDVENAYARRQGAGSYAGCEAYHEFEDIMARSDIDAVVVCTPDHWHSPISVMAMRHGKDVYVQKPMTLTLREGRIMSDTSRQHGAILQVGSQQRSERAFRKACEIVRNGWIGRVHTIYTSLGRFAPPRTLPEQPIPEGFD